MAGNGPARRDAGRTSNLVPIASANQQLGLRACALLNVAALEAVRGRDTACRAHAAEAGTLALRTCSGVLEVWVDHVIGLLELSMGNIAAAAWQLTRCARQVRASGFEDPFVVRYEPDLVEALVALGHRNDAVAVAATLEARGNRFRSSWARAASARCRGLLADEAELAREFTSALALHGSVGSRFELARTELCFGERLRRARRRADARDHLAASLATFEWLGASPWTERARRELEATTLTARPRRDLSTMDDLTPQERQVALIIANGATIREVAAQLFLSPKTIEAHLGRAYRKLGVHNRAQLATTLSRQVASAA